LSKQEKFKLLKEARLKKRAPGKLSEKPSKKLKSDNNGDANVSPIRTRSRSASLNENKPKKKHSNDAVENEQYATIEDLEALQGEKAENEENSSKTNANLPREYFASGKFEDLEICQPSKRALKDVFHFDNMTHIQSRTIPHLLKGRDL